MADFIIKQVAIAVGNAVGGTVGAGVATLAYGTALATREFAELVKKIENGEATQGDVVAAFAAAETTLLGFALVGAVTVPLTIPLLVGLAGLAVFYSRSADATGDAVDATLNPPNGIGNPLDVYKAFERRTKAIEQEKRDRKNRFSNGVNWRQPSDPLVLDLDGDGIELTSTSNTVLFDHNKDNIRTGTGTYKGYTFYSVSIESQRLPFFQAAYDSLKASTYQSLYLQTAGKQLLSNQLKKCKRHYQHRNCLRRKSLIKRLNLF